MFTTVKQCLLVQTVALSAVFVLAPPAQSAAPSKAAAILAIKQKVAAQTGHRVGKNGPLSCVSPGGSGRVWKCEWRTGSADVSFRERKGAWQVTVYLRL